jgi:hypothetical protein
MRSDFQVFELPAQRSNGLYPLRSGRVGDVEGKRSLLSGRAQGALNGEN